MPFKSMKQEKWMFANRPETAKKWAAETPNQNLPLQVPKVPKVPTAPSAWTKMNKPKFGGIK